MITSKSAPHDDRKDDILLDPIAAAEKLGGKKPLSVKTLAKWRCLKTYNLPYTKVGREVRYWQSDILRFLREREQRRTQENP
jgi:hypothetical protein